MLPSYQVSGTFRFQQSCRTHLHCQCPICMKLVLCGIKCHESELGSTSKVWLPITPQILWSLQDYWLSNNQGNDTPMILPACSPCFSASFEGEICKYNFWPRFHLYPLDIATDHQSHPNILRICIKQSKTDPFRKCVQIIVGAIGDSLCPVAAVPCHHGKGSRSLISFLQWKCPHQTDVCQFWISLQSLSTIKLEMSH